MTYDSNDVTLGSLIIQGHVTDFANLSVVIRQAKWS
jgi:hypothetical protein